MRPSVNKAEVIEEMLHLAHSVLAIWGFMAHGSATEEEQDTESGVLILVYSIVVLIWIVVLCTFRIVMSHVKDFKESTFCTPFLFFLLICLSKKAKSAFLAYLHVSIEIFCHASDVRVCLVRWQNMGKHTRRSLACFFFHMF